MTAVRSFVALVRRDISISTHQGAAGLQGVAFFAVVVTLVPFGLGADMTLLGRVAPGLIWVALVLASLLTLDRLFQADYDDGSLDIMILSPLSLEALVIGKCLAHWVSSALPLIIAAPVLGILLNLSLDSFAVLLVTLLLGSPALIFLGAVGAALTIGVRRAGLLIALLILPLYVPTLIFALGAINAAMSAGSFSFLEPNLLFLGALSLFSLVLGPIASAGGLRINLS